MDSYIEFPVQDFNVIYQVVKEVDNFPANSLPEDLSARTVLDEILGVARSVKRIAKESSASKIVFADPADPAQRQRDSRPVVEQESGFTTVRGSFSGGHLSLWPSIMDFVTRRLGRRELFLRTGCTDEEVESARTHLARWPSCQ